MVVLEPVSGGLRTNGRDVPPSGLETNSRISTAQRALRAVIPAAPPPPPPSQSPGGEGGPSGLAVFRRVGEAGFAAQPTIAHGGIA
jgi:hypothetical protein